MGGEPDPHLHAQLPNPEEAPLPPTSIRVEQPSRAAGATIAPLDHLTEAEVEALLDAGETTAPVDPTTSPRRRRGPLDAPTLPFQHPERVKDTPHVSGSTIAPLGEPILESIEAPGTLHPEHFGTSPQHPALDDNSLPPRDFGVPRQPTVNAEPPPPRKLPAPVRPTTPRHLKPGDTLGRWVLETVIGEGATAAVWSAHHEQLGAPVAIKVFHRRGMSFHTVVGEARAAAGIPSRNTIWVYDADTYDGHHAIVMELCASGDQIAESLRVAHIDDWRHAATLMAQAARGVQAAHDSSVFHKDIKPANILVHPGDGRAQITDFGLANPVLWQVLESKKGRREAQSTVSLDAGTVSPSRDHDPHAVIRGTVRVGTPEFMAPEQAEGLRPDLDPDDPEHRRYLVAIDVYGLGATLYAMLTGAPPFPHGELAERQPTAAEIMAQVIEDAPPPVQEFAPKVPRRLAKVVERAMSRDPLERYGSAADFADDLDALVANYPTTQDTSPLVRAAVHIHRNRATVALLTLLTLITVASSAIVWNNAVRIQEQSEELAAQRDELDDLAQTHKTVTNDLDATRTRLSSTELTLEETRTALTAKDDQLHETRGALAARARDLSAVTGRLGQTKDELTNTTERLAETSAQLEEATGSLERTRVALEAAEQERDALETDLSRAEDELGQLRGALDSETTRARELASEVDTLSAAAARQREHVAELERAEIEALQRATDAETRIEEARVRIRQLREENKNLRRILAAPQEPTPAPFGP